MKLKGIQSSEKRMNWESRFKDESSEAAMNFISVAFGGALGAILIGLIVGLASGNRAISANAVLFWKTGVCG